MPEPTPRLGCGRTPRHTFARHQRRAGARDEGLTWRRVLDVASETRVAGALGDPGVAPGGGAFAVAPAAVQAGRRRRHLGPVQSAKATVVRRAVVVRLAHLTHVVALGLPAARAHTAAAGVAGAVRNGRQLGQAWPGAPPAERRADPPVQPAATSLPPRRAHGHRGVLPRSSGGPAGPPRPASVTRAAWMHALPPGWCGWGRHRTPPHAPCRGPGSRAAEPWAYLAFAAGLDSVHKSKI